MLYYQKFFEDISSLESKGVDWKEAQELLLASLKLTFPKASEKQRIRSFQVERVLRESNGYDSLTLSYMSLMSDYFGEDWEKGSVSPSEDRVSKLSRNLRGGLET